MQELIQVKTEEAILHNITQILSADISTTELKAIDDFKYSTIPDENIRRIEALSGFEANDPEFQVQSEILKSIKTARLYKYNPSVEVTESTLYQWKRAFIAIKYFNNIAEDTLRIKCMKVIQSKLTENKVITEGLGENLEIAVLNSIAKYLGD